MFQGSNLSFQNCAESTLILWTISLVLMPHSDVGIHELPSIYQPLLHLDTACLTFLTSLQGAGRRWAGSQSKGMFHFLTHACFHINILDFTSGINTCNNSAKKIAIVHRSAKILQFGHLPSFLRHAKPFQTCLFQPCLFSHGSLLLFSPHVTIPPLNPVSGCYKAVSLSLFDPTGALANDI